MRILKILKLNNNQNRESVATNDYFASQYFAFLFKLLVECFSWAKNSKSRREISEI